MFSRLRADIHAVKERDPASRNSLEILLLYSGIHAIIHYRFAHFFYRHRLFFLARLLSQMGRFWTGIEIHPGAQIGKGFFIDHGMGVVIGETTVIGDNCTLYQGVTLGGTGKDKGKRHPTLQDNVMVGSGAKILGPFTVGENALVAANAVVLSEVPPNSTVAGVPAKVVRLEGKRVNDMDQVNIPNPMDMEIKTLRDEMEKIKESIEELKGVPSK